VLNSCGCVHLPGCSDSAAFSPLLASTLYYLKPVLVAASCTQAKKSVADKITHPHAALSQADCMRMVKQLQDQLDEVTSVPGLT
jgi:hypothetical protein